MSAKPIQTAMIMTAGLGTRMAPLTDDCPKPLLQVGGKALVDHVIDRLVAAGITRIVANLHYKADMMRAHLSNRSDVEILFSDETAALLETGGGIKKALPLLGAKEFIVANTDAFWIEGYGSNLKMLNRIWDPGRMDSLILCAPTTNAYGSISRGDFMMKGDGRLERRGVSTTVPFMMAGIYILKANLFDETPSGPFSTNLLWNRALEARTLFGFRLEGAWLNASRPQDIAIIERTLSAL